MVERATWRIETETSEIEIALDEGQIIADGSALAIAERELELKRGEVADLFGLARNLNKSGAVKVGVLSKSERGYALVDGTPPTSFKAGKVALHRRMSTADAFQAITRSCVRHFRLNEPLVFEARSPEALHQARVALRRLRSAFSLFGDVVADARLDRIKRRLREVSAQFGDARNHDVYLARASQAAEEVDDGEIIARLETDRVAAYDRVIATLESRRFRALMLDVAEWIECGPWVLASEPATKARRDRFVEEFAAEILDRRRRKVKRNGRKHINLDADARHQVRIDSKKLRYASEFFASLVEGKKHRKRHRAFIAALEDLQSSLGELNDIRTGHAMLAGLTEAAESRESKAAPFLVPASRSGDRRGQRDDLLLQSALDAHRTFVKAKPFWR